MADPVRRDAADLVAGLHGEGVRDVAMVTGDRRDVAMAVAGQAGLDRVYPEQSPEDKLAVVRAARERPRPASGRHGQRRRQRRSGAGAGRRAAQS
jgi:P-type E1-E2 ATPase